MKVQYNNEFLYKSFIFIVILIYMFESTSLSNFNDSLFHKILLLLALIVALSLIHIYIDGNYNVNQAGTYTLQYYVQDSDGNTSDPITFTLTVQ